MSTPVINTKIKAEGEKEYKQALTEINSALRSLNSDMRLLSAEFDGNEKSVTALTAVNEKLNQQILTQQEKVEALEGALAAAADTYGEADTKTQGYRASLNKAQEDLIKMEKALRENTDELAAAGVEADNFSGGLEDLQQRTGKWADNLGEAEQALSDFDDAQESTSETSGSLGGVISELSDKLGVSLPDGAAEALDGLGSLDASAVLLAGSFAAVVGAVVGVEQKLSSLTTEAADNATNILNLSQTIGMSTEATQQWDYVLSMVGSSIEDAQGDLSAFQEKMLDAKDSGGEALELFNRLGVNLKDDLTGGLRSTEDVLYDTVKALQQMGDQTERNAISSALLGGTGEKLIPIYSKTSNELDAMMQRKKELGILDEEELLTLAAVKTAQLDANEAMEAGSNAIATKFAPALEEFISKSGASVGKLEKALADSELVTVFGAILDLVTALAPALDVLSTCLTALAPVFKTVAVAIGAVADVLNIVLTIVKALVQLLGFDASGALDTLGGIGDIFNYGATYRALTNASGSDYFIGGRTLLSENGPETAILPQGTRILTAQETRQSMGRGDTYYVTIDPRTVKDFDDIARIAQNQRRMTRMGVVEWQP